MAGRKPIYATDTIKIGKKIEVEGKTALYKDQFVFALNNSKKNKGKKKFTSIMEGGKVFIKRLN